jgi:hypothetical protein
MDSNDPIRNLPLVIEPRVDKKRADTWQIVLTTFGVVAILSIFFWGINNQRDETAGEQTAAAMPTPVAPQGGNTKQDENQQNAGQQPPSTTGQGAGDGAGKNQPHADGQKAKEQSAGGGKEPAQRQTK